MKLRNYFHNLGRKIKNFFKKWRHDDTSRELFTKISYRSDVVFDIKKSKPA